MIRLMLTGSNHFISRNLIKLHWSIIEISIRIEVKRHTRQKDSMRSRAARVTSQVAIRGVVDVSNKSDVICIKKIFNKISLKLVSLKSCSGHNYVRQSLHQSTFDGAGFKADEFKSDLASGFSKSFLDPPTYISLGDFLEYSHFESYVSYFLPDLLDEIKQNAHSILKCRYRFTSSFVSACLCRYER